MKTSPTLTLLIVLLLSGCGGSTGPSLSSSSQDYSSSDSSERHAVVHYPRQLDVEDAATERKTIVRYFGTQRYGPTLDFHFFPDQNAALKVVFDKEDEEVSMHAEVVLFGEHASYQEMRWWIGNHFSDAIMPDAAEPIKRYELPVGVLAEIEKRDLVNAAELTDWRVYEHYRITYSIDALPVDESAPQNQQFELAGLTATTDYYEHAGDLSDIAVTPKPVVEDFSARNAAHFFSPSYRSLATQPANYFPSTFDEHPSFYYPTCCVFGADSLSPDEDRLENSGHFAQTEQGLQVKNARFTVGQALFVSPHAAMPNPKRNSTEGGALDIPDTGALGGWGELDLSNPFRIAACITDVNVEHADGQLAIWIDNNTDDAQRSPSMSNTGQLPNIPLSELAAGERLTINIPGNYYSEHPDTELYPSMRVGATDTHVGLPRSFIQFYVSGGSVTFSALVIESINGEHADQLACEAVR